MKPHWLELVSGSIMIIVGFVAILLLIPLCTKWLAKQEDDFGRPLTPLSDFSHKAAYSLVISGCMIIFLVITMPYFTTFISAFVFKP